MSARVTFLHTADWQVGKPFGRIADPHKQALIRQERLSVIDRIGETVERVNASFVVVAGDLFDSSTASRALVAATCRAIGRLPVPVYVIPGNHDHGGPGTVWQQPSFLTEREATAPNLIVLLDRTPYETDGYVLLPCPLLRRHDASDPMQWLRSWEPSIDDHRPRIVIAHGTVQGFTTTDEDDSLDTTANELGLDRLPTGVADYVALGDWHGRKRITDHIWYSGTPEIDRFPRGEGNEPGYVLAVTAVHGGIPEVQSISTTRFRWQRLHLEFRDDMNLDRLEAAIKGVVGERADTTLLRIETSGFLGIRAAAELEECIATWDARLPHFRWKPAHDLAPSPEEIESLTRRADDPLIAEVASRLIAMLRDPGADAEVAKAALCELHSLSREEQGGIR